MGEIESDLRAYEAEQDREARLEEKINQLELLKSDVEDTLERTIKLFCKHLKILDGSFSIKIINAVILEINKAIGNAEDAQENITNDCNELGIDAIKIDISDAHRFLTDLELIRKTLQSAADHAEVVIDEYV